MKHIIFVKNLNTEEDVKRIKEAFLETRVECDIVLSSQYVVVYGRNDLVHVAKRVLTELGFIIQ